MEPIPVMLVDDNASFLQIAARFLSQSAIRVVGVATDAQEAIRQVKSLCPQVVLLDLYLSGPTGLQVIPLLRAVAPDLAIIILSLYDFPGYREVALAAGADDFVSKEAVYVDLVPAIQRVARLPRRTPSLQAT